MLSQPQIDYLGYLVDYCRDDKDRETKDEDLLLSKMDELWLKLDKQEIKDINRMLDRIQDL